MPNPNQAEFNKFSQWLVSIGLSNWLPSLTLANYKQTDAYRRYLSAKALPVSPAQQGQWESDAAYRARQAYEGAISQGAVPQGSVTTPPSKWGTRGTGISELPSWGVTTTPTLATPVTPELSTTPAAPKGELIDPTDYILWRKKLWWEDKEVDKSTIPQLVEELGKRIETEGFNEFYPGYMQAKAYIDSLGGRVNITCRGDSSKRIDSLAASSGRFK